MADDDGDEDDEGGPDDGDSAEPATQPDQGEAEKATEVTPADEAASDQAVQDQAGYSPVPMEAAALAAPGPDQGGAPAPAPQTGPATTPDQPAPAQPAVVVNVQQGPGTSRSGSVGTSTSHSGVNMATAAQVQAGAKSREDPLEADRSHIAQATEDAARRAEADAAATKQAYQDQAVALARQAQYQADGNAAIARESATWAEQEQIANEQVKNNTAAYMAQVKADIASVKAMRMRPRGLLEDSSPGTLDGLAGATFAQGLLAVKGIHIDAVGAINRAVDQDIMRQEEAIQRGEWVEGQDREMWQMARANAADQVEARGRLRALKLGAMQADIQAHVSSIGSDLAKADGAIAVAKIQSALDDTVTGLTMSYYQKSMDIHKTLLSARLEEYRIAMEHQMNQERIASAEKIASGKLTAKSGLRPFYSPVKGDLGPDGRPRVLGYFAPWVKDQELSRVNESVGRSAKVVDALARYDQAAGRVGGKTGKGRVVGGRVTRLDKDDEAILKAANEDLALAVAGALNPGEKLNNTLVKEEFKTRVPLPTETGASLAQSIKMAHLAAATAINRAQIDAAPYVVDETERPLPMGALGLAGRDYNDSLLTAMPDPSKPGSLDYYIAGLASPDNPVDEPGQDVGNMLNGVYQVARDKTNPDSARALEVLKTVAHGSNDEVSQYLQRDAEALLIRDPDLRSQLSKAEQVGYEKLYQDNVNDIETSIKKEKHAQDLRSAQDPLGETQDAKDFGAVSPM